MTHRWRGNPDFWQGGNTSHSVVKTHEDITTTQVPDYAAAQAPPGVTAAEAYVGGNSTDFNYAVPNTKLDVPPQVIEQQVIKTPDSFTAQNYVETGDTFYPYKYQAPGSTITHDFTGVNQTIAGSTLGHNTLLTQNQMPFTHPLFGFAPKSLEPLRDDARGFRDLVHLSQPNLHISRATIPLHPIGSRNPIYPVPLQNIRGQTDPDFAKPEYGNGEIHGLVTVGGHILDEDEIEQYPSGAAKSKPYRRNIVVRTYADKSLVGSMCTPAGGLDLVMGGFPLTENNQELTGFNGQGQPVHTWTKGWMGGDQVGDNNTYTQRGFPTLEGPDDISWNQSNANYEFQPQWQNTPASRITEAQTGVPGSVYNDATYPNGETGSARGASNYRPCTDIIGINQFPDRPYQWTEPPGSGMAQNLTNLIDILGSAPSELEANPEYQGENIGDTWSLVPSAGLQIAASQLYFEGRPINALKAQANPLVV